MVEVSQNMDFLQKTFLRDTKPDQLTLKGTGTPKSRHFSHVPRKLSDELFLASILHFSALWQPTLDFDVASILHFFAFWRPTLDFDVATTYPGYHPAKADVLRIPKM